MDFNEKYPSAKDGVVKSEFEIVTKMGETYTVRGFHNKKEMTQLIIDCINDKIPVVFPMKDEENRDIDVIIPSDTIYRAKVWDFSSLTIAKPKINRPGIQ